MKYKLICDWCGKPIEKYRIDKHNFCCRKCLADFSNKSKNPNGYSQLKDYSNISAAFSKTNKKLNPTRMTPEVREKLRNARLGEGNQKTYAKFYGEHEHRIVAEQMLGRPLKKGEVVHHIDGNKRNNQPENLLVLSSQSEHASLHSRERIFWNSGGDSK